MLTNTYIDERTFIINKTKVTIKYGDIFAQNGLKVIAFNEYFDTLVDDNIISHNTLNGEFIEKYIRNVNALDKEIEEQIKVNKFQIQKNERLSGKNIQCRLGSIVKFNEFLLLAFSKFHEDNRAFLTSRDYHDCLVHFWSELDRVYAGYPVSLPLLGSGITRVGSLPTEMTNQNLLQEILDTFSNSNIRFAAGLNVILSTKVKEDIDLLRIRS